jgi:hypothetical protein
MTLNINDYVEAAIDDEGSQRSQITNAAAIIAQFLVVKKGLSGRVAHETLDTTAATLTAAIWTNSN